jgi:hypothetical protein
MWRILWRIWGRLWIGFRGLSCRTGLLRGGRPLRGVCTGLGGDDALGLPLVGDDVSDQREDRKGVRTPALRAGGPSGRPLSARARVCVNVILL